MAFFRTTLLLVAGLAGLAAALVESDYTTGKIFKGKGTYYGATEGGNCGIRQPRPDFYSKYQPLAMNDAQYEGMCGACLEVTGTGEGSGANPIVGTFKAYAMDRCPECPYGDIDLAKSGDGRWDVSWKVIPCEGSSHIEFQFEGSHEFYIKMQPRGMKSPAKSVKVNGKAAVRSQDNHWIVQPDSGKFPTPYTVEVVTVLGEVSTSSLSTFSGVVKGAPLDGGTSPPRSPGPVPSPSAAPSTAPSAPPSTEPSMAPSAPPSMAPPPPPSARPSPPPIELPTPTPVVPTPIVRPTPIELPTPTPVGPTPTMDPLMPSAEPMPEPIPVDGIAKTLMHDWFMIRKTGGKKSVYVRVCGDVDCRYCRDEDRTSCYGAPESVHFDSVLTAYSL